MFRVLLIAVATVMLPAAALSSPTQETKENDFLDLVDGEGNILIQGMGIDGVNAKARAQGLRFPALGYWSPEGHCFQKPAAGDCNGVFKK
ncbi:hypothetical protein [Synechococcus sp. CC9616]|jgi:hypothetical protein|uniref:hypothetical protein n=1 Tax=Synechococcus sp. CC9616 TaxID=110663 RepID=UPI0004B117FE|nr:hypothetical protein [Synechococcus sp. CC9616]|tara:strand:- start:442 stop:711 length:270 start_codon:yes stop_codon:yes gene_type:complete